MNSNLNSIFDETFAVTEELAALLQAQSTKIVLAESCSCGMAAALLGQIPGISNQLCGSFVTYRNSAKTDWLEVPGEILDEFSSTSLETSCAMSAAALEKTEEADIAAAITGHLGPDSMADLDGQVFVVLQSRLVFDDTKKTRHQLSATTRRDRQLESVRLLFQDLIGWIGPR